MLLVSKEFFSSAQLWKHTGQQSECGCKLGCGDHSQGSLTCLGGAESSRQVHREGWEATAGRARGCRKTGFIPNISIFTSCPSQPNSGFSSQFHLASSSSSISGNLSKIQILRLYLGPNDRETPRGGHSNWCFTSGLPGDLEAQQSLRTVEQTGPCSFGHLHISGQLLSSASQFTRRQIISKNYNFLSLFPLSLGNSRGITLKKSPQGHPPLSSRTRVTGSLFVTGPTFCLWV